MSRRLSILSLTIASPLVLLLFFVPGEASLWLVSFLTMGFPVALIVLAVSSRDGWTSLAPWMAVLLAVLEISGFGILYFSRHPDRIAAWAWGLPPGALFMLLGLWLLPLFIVSWAYPATFDGAVLSELDLARLRGHDRSEPTPRAD